jgi:hypothetical protein
MLFGCLNQSNNIMGDNIRIDFDQKSNALVVSNLDDSFVNALTREIKADSNLNHSLSVFIKADDEDLQDLETPLAGKYQIINKSIVFLPDITFVKGKNYLIEVYLNDSSGEASNYLRSSGSVLRNKTITKVIKF